MLSKEIDALIGLLERLDHEGRHEESLRLARSLSGLLALALRWVALVQSLRIAFRAAEALADSHAQAWVHHELGSLALGADDAQAATNQLEQARQIRERLGDEQGLAVTERNLELAEERLAETRSGRRFAGRTVLLAAVVAILIAAVGTGVALSLRGHPTPVQPTTTLPVTVPGSPRPPFPADPCGVPIAAPSSNARAAVRGCPREAAARGKPSVYGL